MRRIAGIFLVLVFSTACSAGVNEAKFRSEVEGAYWIVSDGCAYTTDDATLSPLTEGKKRYQHHKVQALGQPRAETFAAVEAQVNELLARMDIDCPAVDSPEALEKLQNLTRDLDAHLTSIDRLLRARAG